eukprot:2639493-Rhodomonas_salina.1
MCIRDSRSQNREHRDTHQIISLTEPDVRHASLHGVHMHMRMVELGLEGQKTCGAERREKRNSNRQTAGQENKTKKHIQTHRDTHRDRDTETQRHRDTGTQRHTQTQTQTQTQTNTDRQTDTHTAVCTLRSQMSGTHTHSSVANTGGVHLAEPDVRHASLVARHQEVLVQVRHEQRAARRSEEERGGTGGVRGGGARRNRGSERRRGGEK